MFLNDFYEKNILSAVHYIYSTGKPYRLYSPFYIELPTPTNHGFGVNKYVYTKTWQTVFLISLLN